MTFGFQVLRTVSIALKQVSYKRRGFFLAIVDIVDAAYQDFRAVTLGNVLL